MNCTILGCGGSNGVPEVNCDCYVCVSTSSLNKRTRSSIYIETKKGIKVLVDTSPDLRIQSLRNNIRRIDAVIYTHAHYDHISGIGDLKKLVNQENGNFTDHHLINATSHWYHSPYFQRKNINSVPAFMDSITASQIIRSFGFAFHTNSDGTYKSLLKPLIFSGPFCFADLEIEPFWQEHGKSYSYGFRFGDLAYSTDMTSLSNHAIEILRGVKVWILDCCRYFHAQTHLSIETMLNLVAKVKAEKVIITHMGHEIEYEEIKKILPKNIEPAYDGMVISI